jgi:hypothetical protein
MDSGRIRLSATLACGKPDPTDAIPARARGLSSVGRYLMTATAQRTDRSIVVCAWSTTIDGVEYTMSYQPDMRSRREPAVGEYIVLAEAENDVVTLRVREVRWVLGFSYCELTVDLVRERPQEQRATTREECQLLVNAGFRSDFGYPTGVNIPRS